MKSLVVGMLLLCGVGFVYSAESEKDISTFGLILRELFKLQSELDKQRSDVGKLSADSETQKSEIDRLKAELEKQKLDSERANSEERARQDASSNRLKSELEKRLQTASYIRWGRTSCDGNATAVYKGYAAGPRYREESGSGSNFLCLHDHPQWKRFRSGSQSTGNIYGVQYEMYEGYYTINNVFSLANNHGGRKLAKHPGPCVMCNVRHRSTVMIPARTECPPGWNKEYGGYIVAAHGVHMKSSYTCWDEAPETAPGGKGHDQSVIYPIEVQCGTLPCSIYDSGRELACVVCSK